MNTFSKNLKRLRCQQNLKQEDLADRLHVTRQTVSGWETGRRQPDLSTLKKLADALDVDVHELIYGDKPGSHPRFQRKHVICTAVSGGIAAVLLLFRLLVLPYLTVVGNTCHWGFLLTVCNFLLPQIGAFSFGSFCAGLILLFVPVHPKTQRRQWYLTACAAALLPVILFWLGFRPFRKWILYAVGAGFLSYIFPLLSGLCFILGAASNNADGHS